jgi:hypothetical protein
LVFIFVAVNHRGLLYQLRFFIVADGTGIIHDFGIRNGCALALAGQYGRCVEGGEPLSAIFGAHGQRSLDVVWGGCGQALLWC